MGTLIIIEDSSKSGFGGGQRVTLDFLNASYSLFSQIQIFDFTYKRQTKFTQRVSNLGYKVFHLIGFGDIGKKPISGYSLSFLEVLLFPIILFLNVIISKYLLKRDSKTNVFYSATKKALILAFFISRKNDRIIFHMHNSDSNFFISKLFRFFISRPNVYNLAVSNFVKNSYNLDNISVVYNGVDLNVQKPKFKIKGTKIVVAYLGSLIAWKGVNVLCSSMQYLDNLNFELLIIGDGVLLNDLKNKFSLNHHIKFLGFVDEVNTILQEKVDILCLPSLAPEACPMSILEALSLGIPIVTTNIGGQAELVNSNIGKLVDLNSPKDTASAILEISQNFESFSEKSWLESEKYSKENFKINISNLFSNNING